MRERRNGSLWRRCLAVAVVLSGGVACGVTPVSQDTVGTSIPEGPCGRGVVVVASDYQSTNLSLVGWDGTVLSRSFLSSGSASSGLSSPLSGDVALPTMAQGGPEIVVLDRHRTSVLTWVNVETSVVRAQISVATGFASNPRDYVPISSTKAYVTRFEPNFAAGAEPYDAGNDVLIVDPSVPVIAGRIDLMPAMQGEGATYYPRADRAARIGDRVVVVLAGYAADFTSSSSSRIAVIDVSSDTLVDVVELEGMHGCSGLAVSPKGDEFAVVCAGEFGGDSVATPAGSGVVLLSAGETIEVRRRLDARQWAQGPMGFAIAYAGETSLVVTTFGRFAEPGVDAQRDALLWIDTGSGQAEVVLRSADDPFTLGEVRCAPVCGVCVLADAGRQGGVVQRIPIDEDGGLGAPEPIVIERDIGLPPRSLGAF